MILGVKLKERRLHVAYQPSLRVVEEILGSGSLFTIDSKLKCSVKNLFEMVYKQFAYTKL